MNCEKHLENTLYTCIIENACLILFHIAEKFFQTSAGREDSYIASRRLISERPRKREKTGSVMRRLIVCEGSDAGCGHLQTELNEEIRGYVSSAKPEWDGCVLSFWKKIKQCYPKLSIMVRFVFTIAWTSTE